MTPTPVGEMDVDQESPENERLGPEASSRRMSSLELGSANQDAHEEEQQGANEGEEDEDDEDDEDEEDRVPADPFEGMLVKLPLRRRTLKEGVTPVALNAAIWNLKRMSAYELVRENNVAKNHEILVSLGLDKSFEEVMGLPKKKAGGKVGAQKRKAGGKVGAQKGGRRAAKRARGEGNCEEEDYKGNSEDEDDDIPPRAPWDPCAKPTPKVAVPKEWVKKAEASLERGKFGPQWGELVEQWYLYEKNHGFVCPVMFFSSCGLNLGANLTFLLVADQGALGQAPAQRN
jgi:hypothetical protein